MKDETVVTWGNKYVGSDCNKVKAALRGVDKIYFNFTWRAFAAVLKSGTVVIWVVRKTDVTAIS